MQAIPLQLADGLPEGTSYGATVESAAPGEVVLAEASA
jgi:septal ring factor EnvC (AmiA/AmiB activator)